MWLESDTHRELDSSAQRSQTTTESPKPSPSLRTQLKLLQVSSKLPNSDLKRAGDPN